MEFTPVKFKNDSTSYIYVSWDQSGDLAFDLAKKILKDNKKFDRLVTMAKGGWTWSRAMADYLKIEEIGSICVKFYTGIFETTTTPVITQSLPTSVANERLLVFDDIADSGETLSAVGKYLNLCGAKSITTSSIFIKPWCKTMPDYYAESTGAWIINPHEIREAIELIGKKWQKQKISQEEIKSRFVKLGLPLNQINYFLKI